MDRLTSMAVFVKAVDLGSFAAAADALALSAPMVGKHVRFLEERLGVRLINRTTRRQSLTDLGRDYYERCRGVLAAAEAADAMAADQQSEPQGRLRVAMSVHFGRHCVAPILLALAKRHPKLELDLFFSDRLIDLADGEYDLAIRTGSLEDSSDVTARRLARQRMVVCAAPSYVKRHGRPKGIVDLATHPAIVYRRSARISPWLFSARARGRSRSCPPVVCGSTISTRSPMRRWPAWASPGCRVGWCATASPLAHWSPCCRKSRPISTTRRRSGCTRRTYR